MVVASEKFSLLLLFPGKCIHVQFNTRLNENEFLKEK